jgi:hypothetical protein
MADKMTFPATFKEFAERYKIVDKEEVYTNGAELIPIFRVEQWLDNENNSAKKIFEEIEKLLKENQFTLLPPYRSEITDWKTVFRLKLASDIAKLKKKYTKSEKDNG